MEKLVVVHFRHPHASVTLAGFGAVGHDESVLKDIVTDHGPDSVANIHTAEMPHGTKVIVFDEKRIAGSPHIRGRPRQIAITVTFHFDRKRVRLHLERAMVNQSVDLAQEMNRLSRQPVKNTMVNAEK